MSESSLHTNLVRSLVDWVACRIDTGGRIAVFSDLPEIAASDKPPCIGGFYPDVYCASADGLPLFLGEAKTARDLESRRSREQIDAYSVF